MFDENILQLVFTKRGITIMRNYEKISEARFQLDLGRCGSDIEDYDSGYITDIYMEIADNHTSIYYDDIANYLADNIHTVNDWISENGYPGDLYEATQGAEYDSIYHDLQEHSDDILLYWAYMYLWENYGAELERFGELVGEPDLDYLRRELSFDVARLDNVRDQADDLVTDLLDMLDEEEQG